MRLYWLSPFSLADGYGVAATAFIQMLTYADWDLNLHETWFCVRSELEKKIVKKLQADSSKLTTERLGVALSTPGSFRRLPTPIKVGYTMYESTNPELRFSDWYKEMAVADALLVPTEYSASVFSHQYKGPIYIQPIPLLAQYMQAQVKPRFTGNVVTFGMHGTLTERKCPLETIRAFQAAFPPRVKDVRLELKTRVVLDQSHNIPGFSDPRIKIINETWSPSKLLSWLYDIDCHLFISKGEGFGLPPRETLATGCPVIVSETSGLLDLKGHTYTVPIKGHSRTHIGGMWDEPDFDAAVELMRYVYDHREEAAEKGLQGAEWYRDEYSWDSITKKFQHHLGRIDSEFKTKPVSIDFGHRPMPEEDVGKIGNLIRSQVEPRSSILLAGFDSDALGAWLARRAFSVVYLGPAESKEKYKNLVHAYGDKYELANSFPEQSFRLIILNVSPEELRPGPVYDLLEQGFQVSKEVTLLIPGSFKNRYAILFEGLESNVSDLGNWQLINLKKSETSVHGALMRNLAALNWKRKGRKQGPRLEHFTDGVFVRR